jgi:hypothetical protein
MRRFKASVCSLAAVGLVTAVAFPAPASAELTTQDVSHRHGPGCKKGHNRGPVTTRSVSHKRGPGCAAHSK